MTLHIFTVRKQPATRYHLDPLGDGGFWIRHAKRCQIRTVCCRKLRWAQNLFAQPYYDGTYYSCRPGCGCRKGRG